MSGVTGVQQGIERWPLSTAIRKSGGTVTARENIRLPGPALLDGRATVIVLAARRCDGLRGLSVAPAGGLRHTRMTGLLSTALAVTFSASSTPAKHDAVRLKLSLLVVAVATTSLGLVTGGRASKVLRRAPARTAFLLWLGAGVC